VPRVTDGERCTEHLLNVLKIRWKRIPEMPSPRADYEGEDDRDAYVFEVKERGPDDEYEAMYAQTGQALAMEKLGRLNPLSRQVREATKQLAATPAPQDALRLIVSAAAQDNALSRAQEEQMHATVFGSVNVISPGLGGSAFGRPCLWFTFSEFFELRDLDGVIVLLGPRCRLLVNSFARRVERLRCSGLYRTLGAAVVDPPRSEAAGHVLVADCDIDRRDEAAVLEYVKRKYDLSVAHSSTPTLIRSSVVVEPAGDDD
jgi:hypothetical protein